MICSVCGYDMGSSYMNYGSQVNAQSSTQTQDAQAQSGQNAQSQTQQAQQVGSVDTSSGFSVMA